MGTFNSKTFNSNVFLQYLNTIPKARLVALLKSGAIVLNNELALALPAQTGGNYITRPIKGRLSGAPVIYDGATDITSNTLGTYTQGIVAIGRAKGFDEKDFTESITGHDFMSDVAIQLADYWDEVNEELLLSILKGIFGSALSANVYDCADVVGVTSANNAMTAVAGDLKKHFGLIFMHSNVAKELENQKLLEYLKYNDANGIERVSDIAQWGQLTVFVTDEVPAVNVDAVYVLTSDVSIVAGKTYYTRSGNVGSYVYTPVASPDVTDIATYYEKTANAYTEYTSYILGKGAFEYAPLPVKVPIEMARDPKDDGGIDTLYSRERLILAPFGVSFKTSAMASTTPTDGELETSSSWELVKDTSGNAISTKVIPFVAMKTRSNK